MTIKIVIILLSMYCTTSDKKTQIHLKNVYGSLGVTMLCAGAGATLYLLSMFQVGCLDK